MRNVRTVSIVINPSDGGHLMTRSSSERAGHLNYTVKRNFRREFDQEVRREGYDYFYPMVNLPIGNQPFPQNQPSQAATSLPINLLHEVRHGNGDLAVMSGTETDLYVMFPYKNMMPYIEPGETPDDDYTDIYGGSNWTPYEDPPGTWNYVPPPASNSGSYSYGYASAVNIANGPVTVPPPNTDTPEDTPPDPASTSTPFGIGLPPYGQPDITPPAGYTMEHIVYVNAGYYIQTGTDSDETAQSIIEAMDLSIIQCLGVLLQKQLAYMLQAYQGWQVNISAGQNVWWSNSPVVRPWSALQKIACDPTLTPSNGVGDVEMGPVGSPMYAGTINTYFFAYPP